MYTIYLSYHLECLTPPLDDIPEGDWYCSHCEANIGSFKDGSPVITPADSEDSVSICSSDDEVWSSFSSDEESSASFSSEIHISSTDDELETDSEEENHPHSGQP